MRFETKPPHTALGRRGGGSELGKVQLLSQTAQIILLASPFPGDECLMLSHRKVPGISRNDQLFTGTMAGCPLGAVTTATSTAVGPAALELGSRQP
jgi:hypothetical protein